MQTGENENVGHKTLLDNETCFLHYCKVEDDKHCFTLSSDLVLYNLISTKRVENNVPLILKVHHIQIHAQPMKNRAC